jgi:hypothetical protein
MRKRLMAAAAFSPLALLGFSPAQAQTTISNSQSTPVATATTGDLTIASGGTINPTTSGNAVTINSNNSVTNSGSITFNNLDNSTGIIAQGGYSGTITNAGAITVSESYTPSDSVNSDGVTEAPFAQGTNRYGIHLLGPFTGSLINSGSITIQGNNSVGIAIDGGLNGSVSDTGTVAVTGDNGFGIRTAGEITGGVQISSTVSVKGQNSVGVQTGQIDGSLTVYSSVTATGYSLTTRTTGTTALQNIEKTPTDVEQGGAAFQVQGSVAGGILLGAPPTGVVSTDTVTDADGDGIVDSVEGTAALSSYGSAPALQIGSSAGPISIGQVAASGENAFGLVIRGTIAASGVYDGFSATAVDIGAGNAGVTIAGGMNIVGTVSATAYQANATAIHLESGATVPTVELLQGTYTVERGQGIATASITSGGANTATVLQIDAGARVTSLANYGTMIASATGDTANAIVVVDKSGTLSRVENTGTITAALTAAEAGGVTTGKAVALDLSANTTGVTLRQELDGVTTPSITGDVYLGSGPNTVQLLSGTLYGSLGLGSAASSITIDNGAIYQGALTYSGSALSVNVINGTLQNNSATTVGTSNLSVGSSGVLIVALDPRKNANTFYNVSGSATIASGAKIGATLLSVPTAAQTFTIVKAGSLSVGSASTLLNSLPYLVTGSLSTTSNAINLTVTTKTPAQLGLNKSETSAYSAILAALPQDTSIQTAIVSPTTQAAFAKNYDQMLPESSGAVFETAMGMSKAVSRATADRFDMSTQHDEDDEEGPGTGTWASEFYTGMDQNKAENNAYHSAGLGVIGGIDWGGFGATVALASANITLPHSSGNDTLNSVSTVEGGLYAAPRYGPLSLDARIGVAYLSLKDRRQFTATIVSGDLSSTTSVSRTAEGSWSGYDLTGHIGAGFQANVTKHLFFQPKVYADFFHVHEGAYSEAGGGNGLDLNVSSRDSTQTSGTISVVTGMKFGSTLVYTPQIELGYNKVVQGGPGDTTAKFAYGGSPFTVVANGDTGGAVARLTLKADGNYVHFSLQGGGEFRSDYHSLDLKAVFRLTY